MPADELGSVWNSDPVRIAQSIKPVGEEQDREKKRHEREQETPERSHDSVELSSEVEPLVAPTIVVHEHEKSEDEELIPGSHIDVTVGK